jgi:hypothetical protein
MPQIARVCHATSGRLRIRVDSRRRLDHGPVAHQKGGMGRGAGERVDRTFGLDLGEEADGRVDQHDADDHQGIRHPSGGERQHR